MIGLTILGHRIEEVIRYHEVTKSKFAKDLNVSPSMASKICSGKATPSDRTISDICRIYGVNRKWLEDGIGEMIVPRFGMWTPVFTRFPEMKSVFVKESCGDWSYEESDDLLLCTNTTVFMGHLYRADDGVYGVDEPGRVYRGVTHWMPLPPIPIDVTGGADNGL